MWCSNLFRSAQSAHKSDTAIWHGYQQSVWSLMSHRPWPLCCFDWNLSSRNEVMSPCVFDLHSSSEKSSKVSLHITGGHVSVFFREISILSFSLSLNLVIFLGYFLWGVSIFLYALDTRLFFFKIRFMPWKYLFLPFGLSFNVLDCNHFQHNGLSF